MVVVRLVLDCIRMTPSPRAGSPVVIPLPPPPSRLLGYARLHSTHLRIGCKAERDSRRLGRIQEDGTRRPFQHRAAAPTPLQQEVSQVHEHARRPSQRRRKRGRRQSEAPRPRR